MEVTSQREAGFYCVSDLLCSHGACDTSHIGQSMLSVIPTPIGQVNPAHKGHWLVNDNNLLMMCPQIDRGGNMIRMAHHLDHKHMTHMMHILYTFIHWQ